MSVEGWAYVNAKGEIDVRTVSETEQAAKVNAICLVGNVMPEVTWTERLIDLTFRETTDGTVQRVTVRLKEYAE